MKLCTKQNLMFSTLLALMLSSQAGVAGDQSDSVSADAAQDTMVSVDAGEVGEAPEVPEGVAADADQPLPEGTTFDSNDE